MEEGTMRMLLVLFLISVFLITGCQTIPKDALTLSLEAKVLAQRQIQTRKYQTPDEAKILAACAGLLQDMGFNIDESETKLGLISSSKLRSANNTGQIIVDLLTGVPAERIQKMRACIVTRPVGENGEYVAVRVTFQRIVWDIEGNVTRYESLTDPKIYQEFFDKLSKAVFLESQEL
jgi:hypothetical protein